MFNKILKNVGIYGYLGFAVLAGLFIFGEISLDTEFRVVALIALGFTAALAVMMFLVLTRSPYAKLLIYSGAALIVLESIGSVVWAREWREWTSFNGPILPITAFVVSMVAAVWAFKQPKPASVVMMVVSGAPLVASVLQLGRMHLGGSTFALSIPGVIAGIMIFMSQRPETRSTV